METVVLFLSGIPIWISFKFLLAIIVAVQLSVVDYFAVLQKAEHDAQQKENVNSNIQVFDYIIVGGGTAGCVLGKRLSENPSTTVLLIDQGGDPNPLTRIPIMSARTAIIDSEQISSQLPTTKQSNACLAFNGTCTLIIGKGLGGTSNNNALIYTRGSPQIFDKWAELTKNEKWRYENVLKFFKKSEDYHGYYKPIDSKYHSTGGEWYISNTDMQDTSPALKYFLSAAEKAGYPFIDLNNGDQARSDGYGHYDFYIKNGDRWGTYAAFLQPVLSRTNLHVFRYSRAIKVGLQIHNEVRATGVTYIRNKVVSEVYARKEIILSAGTLGSAELLLRSGIGPRAHLKSLDIPVNVDLPVGNTLIDHVVCNVVFSINKTIFFYPERDTTPGDLIKYFISKTGYLAKGSTGTGFIYTRSSKANKFDTCPDLELTYGSLMGLPLPSTVNGRDYFALSLFLLNPKSTGDFKLRSKDIGDNPLINPNLLSHADDLDAAAEGIQTFLKLILTSPVFASLDTKFEDLQPACQEFEFNTKEYWKCFVSSTGIPASHIIGTCRMGVGKEDVKAVVDSELNQYVGNILSVVRKIFAVATTDLKVLGVAGLRVVDASVMPTMPNTHISAAIVMIAEMGANFILTNSS